MFLNPAAYISAPIGNCGQLSHQSETLDTHLTQTGFTFAVGNGGVHGIDSCHPRLVQNRGRLIPADLASLVGNAIGQAELNGTEGEATVM